ncbi:WYL domain [Phytophthora infestans]|uniref:WYL domain n=1 Tax=Phytophthora infestans TaxID=4787 RepID=A0A833S8X0_PHYIN|nr:WYL domain [Phytophthora infestans]
MPSLQESQQNFNSDASSLRLVDARDVCSGYLRGLVADNRLHPDLRSCITCQLKPETSEGSTRHPENDSEDEERALSTREMKKMKKKLTTKEDFAATLGIADKISDNLNGGALMRFMQTTEYQKDRAYMDFLNDMAKKPKYADLVRQIKGH